MADLAWSRKGKVERAEQQTVKFVQCRIFRSKSDTSLLAIAARSDV